MRAKGNLDFFSKLEDVGIAFSVLRTYFGLQFACGDGVTDELGGRMIGGGGWSKSLTWNG